MNSIARVKSGVGVILLLLVFSPSICDGAPSPQGELLSSEGSVDFARGQTNWSAAVVGQPLLTADRLRTLARSRAMLQMAELGRIRVNELTTLEVLPAREATSKATLDVKAGAIYFFTRERPREFNVQVPYALAGSRGTEFSVAVAPDGGATFAVLDGEIELSNPLGRVLLTNGDIGTANPGQAPAKTAVLQTVNLVQWWTYYPGVLDPDELALTAAEENALVDSIARYREGDLLGALKLYPADRVPASDAERLYLAALLLSVGEVENARYQIAGNPSGPFEEALKLLILTASGNHPPLPTTLPDTATGWLVRSYLQQAMFDLAGALESARVATRQSPRFGFARVRVAELEYGYGNWRAAQKSLDQGLQFAPHNAQAVALNGFLAAAAGRDRDARQQFDSAIELDPALGNGWLGRGLMRLRSGDDDGGRADLQTAAALEATRSLLRSYLGKAFDNSGNAPNAFRELALATRLDAADPTPWLYSALLLRQELRFNEAISDLERSVELNDNRRVYRSRLTLDEDRAVRSSSLATVYQNAGMDDVSVREASTAVAFDYANPSAHLFLADSLNALRDPTRFNLRVETPWFNELLLAHLLAPVGGGNLSQNISQQEYSRLFERDHQFGFSSSSEYRSDGQTRELASTFGTHRDTGYAVDLDYAHNEGVRPNNQLSRLEVYTTLKQQLTPYDSVLAIAKFQDYHSGDNFQYYDPSATTTNLQPFGINNAPVIHPDYHFDLYQHPIFVLGLHHEWAPGIDTLFLGGRLENDQRFRDKNTSQIILTKDANGLLSGPASQLLFDPDYRSRLEIYTGEINQIVQGEHYHLVYGARFQSGDFQSTDILTLSPAAAFAASAFNSIPASGDFDDTFQRITGYGYNTVEILPHLLVTAGLAYDQVIYPQNFRQPPISGGSTSRSRLNPKAAIVWSPCSDFTFRAVHTRALGGVELDQSFQLEPSELAGFYQTFRTIISESVVGAVSAPTFETTGAAMDLRLGAHTYLGLQGQILRSTVSEQIGVFDFNNGNFPVVPSGTAERLDYSEPSFVATLNQLVSDDWSFGAQYRYTRSKLHTVLQSVPAAFYPSADQITTAALSLASIFALFNHPSGFFAKAELNWYHQDNGGYSPELASDEFYQANFLLGYRLKRQRGEIAFGVLDVNDANYRLNPLNPYYELPRERVFVTRLKINL